jgi:hypothetical protein
MPKSAIKPKLCKSSVQISSLGEDGRPGCPVRAPRPNHPAPATTLETDRRDSAVVKSRDVGRGFAVSFPIRHAIPQSTRLHLPLLELTIQDSSSPHVGCPVRTPARRYCASPRRNRHLTPHSRSLSSAQAEDEGRGEEAQKNLRGSQLQLGIP